MNSYGYDEASAGAFAFGFIFGVIIYVINAWFMGRVFNKLGIKAWRAWIPVYSQWVFLEAGGFKGYLILIGLLGGIPFLGFFASIAIAVILTMAAYRIGAGFHKSAGWTVLYFFLPFVWAGILAFNKDHYDPQEARVNGANPDVYPADRAELGIGTNYGNPNSNPYNS